MYMQKGTAQAVQTYTNRMSVDIVSIPLLEIGDFYFRIKQKRFLTSDHFSSRTMQIYVLFLTMQRSYKDIITYYSPNNKIF